jgi:serine/threonine protein kinase
VALMSYFYLDNDEIKQIDLRSSLTNGKKTVGRYEIVRVLGRGAFGTVKLAVDPTNGNKVRCSFAKVFLLAIIIIYLRDFNFIDIKVSFI